MFRKKAATLAVVGLGLFGMVESISPSADAATSHPRFIKDLHQIVPASKKYTNNSNIVLGEAICAVLRDGGSVSSVVGELLGSSQKAYTPYQLGEFLEVSVYNLCHKYTGAVNRWGASNSSKAKASTKVV